MIIVKGQIWDFANGERRKWDIIFRGVWVKSASNEVKNVWQRCAMHIVMELPECFLHQIFIKLLSNRRYRTKNI